MTEKRSTKSGQTFEKSLERLESIVGDMEDGSLSLEKMMARFEEGQDLIRQCTGKLNEVERKIETLIKKGDVLSTEPLDAPTESVETNSPGDEAADELF
jgi:exodeoxyribonuclease VII small subunit